MNVHDAVFTFGDSRATMATLPRAAVLRWRSAVPDRWRRAMGKRIEQLFDELPNICGSASKRIDVNRDALAGGYFAR